jgi:hypothetical protein
VNVETRLVKRVGLFNDLLQCVGCDKVITFPPQYSDVAMIYINFISGDHVNKRNCNILKEIEDGNLLPQALKLCHYLDDNYFLKFLVSYMHGVILRPSRIAVCNFIPKHVIVNKRSSYQDMISNLPVDLQRDIYLLCPFVFAPIQYQNSQAFFESWIELNVKTSNETVKSGSEATICHMIDNEYLYFSDIKFHDEKQTDIKEFNCKNVVQSITLISLTIIVCNLVLVPTTIARW